MTDELNAVKFKNYKSYSSSIVEPISLSEIQTLTEKVSKVNKKISQTLNQLCLHQEIYKPVLDAFKKIKAAHKIAKLKRLESSRR